MSYMEIPLLRLNRAIEHINQFAAERDAFFKTNPFRVVTERHSEGGQDFLSLFFRIDQHPPKHLSIIAGDCIHNLRSILDNIIWSLGQIYGPVSKRIFFPISNSRPDYRNLIKRNEMKGINMFPVAAINLIENMQPYHASDPAVHPLYVLNRLWNDDKHRTPAIMAGVNHSLTLKNITISGPGFIKGGAIYDGDEMLRTAIREGSPEPNIDGEAAFTIVFDKNGPASEMEVIYVLNTLHNFVRDEIIAKFEPFFPKT